MFSHARTLFGTNKENGRAIAGRAPINRRPHFPVAARTIPFAVIVPSLVSLGKLLVSPRTVDSRMKCSARDAL